MSELSVELNLKAHLCGTGADLKKLYTAADVEGHLGKDKRLYCVDLARFSFVILLLCYVDCFLLNSQIEM
jgi:hypothetical protein